MSVRAENDVIRVSWATPSGFFTTITLRQCRDSVDTSDDCISHDVTDVTTLSVSRSSGALLSLVVWQDRDDVVSYDIPKVSNYGRSTPTRGDCTDSKKQHILKKYTQLFYLFVFCFHPFTTIRWKSRSNSRQCHYSLCCCCDCICYHGNVEPQGASW